MLEIDKRDRIKTIGRNAEVIEVVPSMKKVCFFWGRVFTLSLKNSRKCFCEVQFLGPAGAVKRLQKVDNVLPTLRQFESLLMHLSHTRTHGLLKAMGLGKMYLKVILNHFQLFGILKDLDALEVSDK